MGLSVSIKFDLSILLNILLFSYVPDTTVVPTKSDSDVIFLYKCQVKHVHPT